tara:strand:+ start:1259 stop:1573 length:315 start_codon:yes stop_codon:yes gene_type:complete
MSQYNKLMRGALTNPEPQMPRVFLDDRHYEQLMDAMNNPGKRMPWIVVLIITVMAAGDAITPGFPFPGSAIIMVPLAAGVWIKKLSEYGVAKEQIAQAKELQSG